MPDDGGDGRAWAADAAAEIAGDVRATPEVLALARRLSTADLVVARVDAPVVDAALLVWVASRVRVGERVDVVESGADAAAARAGRWRELFSSWGLVEPTTAARPEGGGSPISVSALQPWCAEELGHRLDSRHRPPRPRDLVVVPDLDAFAAARWDAYTLAEPAHGRVAGWITALEVLGTYRQHRGVAGLQQSVSTIQASLRRIEEDDLRRVLSRDDVGAERVARLDVVCRRRFFRRLSAVRDLTCADDLITLLEGDIAGGRAGAVAFSEGQRSHVRAKSSCRCSTKVRSLWMPGGCRHWSRPMRPLMPARPADS